MSATNEEIMGKDVANLYAVYGKLSSASSNPALMAAESASYETILASVKGSDACKQLAGDYIPQFLHHFPALVETGINAQLDLVEDEKATIRVHAIRGLELVCKHNPSTVGRIADVLAQLLIVGDALELSCVKSTFSALFTIDAKAAFLAICTQCANAQDAALRKTVLDFLQAQLKTMTPALKKDAEASAAICQGIKTILATQNAALRIGRDELRFFVQTLIALCPHGNAPAKIRADETLKAELSLIALTQSGLAATGVIDIADVAALKHFLSVQGVISNLVKEYGIDGSPFASVFFQQLLPNLEAIADVDLRNQALHSIASAASTLTPKQAQTFFTTFFTIFKQIVPTGEIVAKPAAAAASSASAPAPAASAEADAAAAAAAAAIAAAGPKINFATAEVFVYLCHILAPLAPEALKQTTGIFTPTGQPGENLSAPSEKRDEFLNRIQYLIQSAGAYKDTLHVTSKAITEQIKQGLQKIARLNAIALGKTPADRVAAMSASTGQPTGPVKPAPVAVAPETPEPTIDEVKAAGAVLRTQQQSIQAAVRLAASVAAIAKPLLTKPLPTFLPAWQLNLSYRSARRSDGDKKGQQQQKGGKPQQQQQQGGKQQQSSQQSQQGKGQKRKSVGPEQQTKGASTKKRGQQSQQQPQQQQQQKKQKTDGQQQGQRQQQNGGGNSQSGKKQKQGGNSNSNKGGRRR